MCPLVLHLEQYGCSGQSFLRWPGCLQWKQSRPSGALDLFSCLLLFTPSPFTYLGTCCCGEMDTELCVSAAGMKGWVGGLVFVLIGDCCLGCVVGGIMWCVLGLCVWLYVIWIVRLWCRRLWRHNQLWWCMLRWCAGNTG